MLPELLWQKSRSCWQHRRALSALSKFIEEGDCVFVRVKDESKEPVFTKPLHRGGTTVTRWGNISHEDLIGKRPRDIIPSKKGIELRVHVPTLEEYVVMTPRLVTPIYPADANLMVSLLDIHVTKPDPSEEPTPPLEILEAGTGHGALTLFLARAIHAANPHLPARLLPDQAREHLTEESIEEGAVREASIVFRLGNWFKSWAGKNNSDSSVGPSSNSTRLNEWKTQRRAVIHTLDVSSAHSLHARWVVGGFKRGIYAGNVDFGVGDVSAWIDQQLTTRNLDTNPPTNRTFLSHIILDLPGSHQHIAKAASVLDVDGVLLIFNPSITQITSCVEMIRREKLPLILDRVVELGAGMTGGRLWDIRAVRPRAATRAEKERQQINSDDGEESEATSGAEIAGQDERTNLKTIPEADGANGQSSGAVEPEQAGLAMICRPKVGNRVVGGGFVGVWRKMRPRDGYRG